VPLSSGRIEAGVAGEGPMTPPPENRGATRRPRLRAVPRVEAADPAADPMIDLTADPMIDPATDRAPAPAAPPAARPGEPDPRALRRLRRLRRRARLARARVAPDFEEDPVVLPDVPEAAPPQVAPVPPRARPKARHWGVLASFALLVLAPFALSVWYLYARAADQYHSQVAFSIRSEEGSSAVAAGILGALTQIGSGSASDTDILFEYIRSQRIVEEIDPELDLRAMFRKAPGDPVFTLGEDDSIEALVAEWNRKVEVGYDSSGGIIHVRANAFTPADAQAIAEAILAHSSALVNRLSDQAREDAVRYAKAELGLSEARLKSARQALADFRRANRLVDPGAEAGGQTGLLNALQTQLAQALVDRDVMLSYAEPTDQRVVQVGRRIDAIRERIDAERGSLGLEGSSGSLPDVLSAYEALQVDLEFANTAYTRSLAALTAANAEARRQSRYLAPHIEPTEASTALYPRRLLLAGLTGLFLLLGWGVAMLIYYNARDNR
jgi:capsular polysaccharide transport system permease protein